MMNEYELKDEGWITQSEKIHTSATFSTKNPKSTVLALKRGLRNEFITDMQ